MFGLMRARRCGREGQRLYCGTCKSIGRLYGQPARAMLNHDAVFLGELLIALAPPDAWPPAIVPRRCAALPGAAEVPPALAYAATVNIVLTEVKVSDAIGDASRLFAVLRLALMRPFSAARRRLAAWQFPVDALWEQVRCQDARERQPTGGTLDAFSAPTAVATGIVFRHGARVIDRPECAEALATLGEAFGRLIYTVDAAVDRVADRRRGAFNAAEAAGVDSDALRGYLRARLDEALVALERLPISEALRRSFQVRLRRSVARACAVALPMADEPGPVRPSDEQIERELRSDAQRRRRAGWRGGGHASGGDSGACCCDICTCSCDVCTCGSDGSACCEACCSPCGDACSGSVCDGCCCCGSSA